MTFDDHNQKTKEIPSHYINTNDFKKLKKNKINNKNSFIYPFARIISINNDDIIEHKIYL